MKLSKKLFAVWLGIMFLVGVAFMSGTKDTKSAPAPVEQASVSAEIRPTPAPQSSVFGERGNWTQQNKADYLAGCLADGTVSDAYCDCTLEQAERTFSAGEAAEMGQGYEQTGELPEAIMEIVYACADHLSDDQ